MEELRTNPPRPGIPPAAPGPITEAATDIADVARRARAEPEAADPVAVAIVVKASSTQAARIAATPDTTIGDIHARACADLGLRDPERWLIVANGEMLTDRSRTVGEVVGDRLGQDLNARLVKQPEAGGAACPS
jgi:hypothetical protein